MLRVTGLVKTFAAGGGAAGPTLAVDNLSLGVENGELLTVLGPSGCGKTTTLRCIAGLETPDQGEIEVQGRLLFSALKGVRVPANERGLGMVFQSYAIWPHMNVFANVAFPLRVLPRRTRPSRKELRQRVERALAAVKLEDLDSRQATDLSGGQQQRLALARALVLEPPLLLLDEPLSNLDARLREEMVFELHRLQRELGITAIYVTHDQTEALAMSDRVAVMRDGRIEQVGKPREVYEKPTTRFVADFIGASNFIEGTVAEREHGITLIRTPQGDLRIRSAGDFPAGTKIIVLARPEQVALEPALSNGTAPNRWRGRIEAQAFLGESVDHIVSVGSREIRVRTASSISIPRETDVQVMFPEDGCLLIRAE
jgi:iron(III) transport system ATP-binding protein